MNRYVWSLDNRISETDKILIKKGEMFVFVLYNNSMMRHPMHLHGLILGYSMVRATMLP